MNILTYGSMALLAVALIGCESPSKLSEPTGIAPVETRVPVATAGAGSPAATPGAASQSRVATVDLARTLPGGAAGAGAQAAAAALAAASQRIVYFDFDSFVIKDDFKSLLDSHAKVLTAAKAKRMVIEGHTDERGGREYNLALGQKRAEAVVHSLTLLGVSDKQLEAVSFGEERPAAQGSDEQAWSRNRRAELKDR